MALSLPIITAANYTTLAIPSDGSATTTTYVVLKRWTHDGGRNVGRKESTLALPSDGNNDNDVSAQPVSNTIYDAFFTDVKKRVLPGRNGRFTHYFYNLRFTTYMHNLRFTPNMQNIRLIIILTCTNLGSKGVGGVEA